MHTTYLILYL